MNFMGSKEFEVVKEAAPNVSNSEYHCGLGWRMCDSKPDVLAHYGYLNGAFSLAVVGSNYGVAVARPERVLNEVKGMMLSEI